MSMDRIVVTGGGSAGHVLPIIPLIEKFIEKGIAVHYVGSHAGIERELISSLNIEYRAIRAGKLRRYFSYRNLIDFFGIPVSVLQAYLFLREYSPNVVFSKGGYVAFPVVVAAWILRIPVVAHESDLTPGLANRLCLKFLETLCVNFPETKAQAKRKVVTGIPLRRELVEGDRTRGRDYLGLANVGRPLLLVFGGSLGAHNLNLSLRASLPLLLPFVDVVHICGRGKADPTMNGQEGYVQKEFVSKEWGDVLAAADVVVSRAGANTIYELIALGIPHLLVPLPLAVSRGDQLENAALMQHKGLSMVRQEEGLTPSEFVKCVQELLKGKVINRDPLGEFSISNSTSKIFGELVRASQKYKEDLH